MEPCVEWSPHDAHTGCPGLTDPRFPITSNSSDVNQPPSSYASGHYVGWLPPKAPTSVRLPLDKVRAAADMVCSVLCTDPWTAEVYPSGHHEACLQQLLAEALA